MTTSRFVFDVVSARLFFLLFPFWYVNRVLQGFLTDSWLIVNRIRFRFVLVFVFPGIGGCCYSWNVHNGTNFNSKYIHSVFLLANYFYYRLFHLLSGTTFFTCCSLQGFGRRSWSSSCPWVFGLTFSIKLIKREPWEKCKPSI